MNRWSRWAERLRRRHGRRERAGVARTLTLVHRGGSVASLHIVNRRTALHLHLRLGVVAVPSPSLFARGVATRGVSRSEPTRGQSALPIVRTVLRPDPPAVHDLERSARLDALPAFVRAPGSFVLRTPAPRESQQSQTLPAARTLPMLLATRRGHLTLNGPQTALSMHLRQRAVREEWPIARRTTVLRRTTAVASVAEAETQEGRRDRLTPARPDWAPPPAAVNVDALTNQVIQQLDRRLLAYRERMGRV